MKVLIKIGYIGLFLLLGFTYKSCTSTKDTIKNLDEKELQVTLKNKWVLLSIDGTDAKEVFKGTIPTLNFDFEKNRIFGNSGCNQYNGAFTLIENTYTPSPIISTRMACGALNQESKFLNLLEKKSTLLYKDYTLQFIQDQKVVLEFKIPLDSK